MILLKTPILNLNTVLNVKHRFVSVTHMYYNNKLLETNMEFFWVKLVWELRWVWVVIFCQLLPIVNS